MVRGTRACKWGGVTYPLAYKRKLAAGQGGRQPGLVTGVVRKLLVLVGIRRVSE